MNRFKNEKGVYQGCILSPCIFNFYAEHIMRNPRLEKSQAGIKIAGSNINNFRYPDNTTLMVESEREVKWSESHSVVSDCLRPHGLYIPWNALGQNTGVGSLSLLQGIFPIQGSNPGLSHCRQILYQLSHKGSPESEEELKSLLMKVKGESENAGLKLNIQKMKIMASSSVTSWKIAGETMKIVTDFIFLDSKTTVDWDCSHKFKRHLQKSYDKPR